MRILLVAIFLSLFGQKAHAQNIIELKIDFFDYCWNSDGKNIYESSIFINDSITIKQIIDTNYFEFNLPIFLISQNLKISVIKMPESIVKGSICYPEISQCQSKPQDFVVQLDSLKDISELRIHMNKGFQKTSCFTLPEFQFGKNSSEIQIVKNEHENNWDFYCLAEILMGFKTVEIIGHADSNELNPVQLSSERATAIKNELIKFGMSENQILTNGQGVKNPVISEKIIALLQSTEEQDAARLKNARVTIRPIK